MPRRELPDVRAAGAVVTRRGRQVLLVHRPRYDDWSFPKGKLDLGEHPVAAAIREVFEETGLHIRLGPPLSEQRYSLGRAYKRVSYWVGRVVGEDAVDTYWPNDEIDDLRWVGYDLANRMLTYPYDRGTLEESLKVRKNTRALVVLRHGNARSRKAWRGDDRLRPLLKTGSVQAERVVPLLAAYDTTTLWSSSSTRCVQTLAPYADLTGWKLRTTDGLAEEDATPESVAGLVDDLLGRDGGAVLCTHRPVLPWVFDALRVARVKLEPADMLVVHHRRGRVVAAEHHQPR
jgi:8-oxo-dGTP pyrophosphatase MutT (NUDIX family)/phosphohistidine phosphatase SixA